MERETKTIKTPNGHEVILKSYITGKENQQIEGLIYQKVDIQGGRNFKLNAGFITEQTNKALELVVVSIDGQTDDVLNKILELRVEDYKAIVKEVNQITQGLTEEKKSE